MISTGETCEKGNGLRGEMQHTVLLWQGFFLGIGLSHAAPFTNFSSCSALCDVVPSLLLSPLLYAVLCTWVCTGWAWRKFKVGILSCRTDIGEHKFAPKKNGQMPKKKPGSLLLFEAHWTQLPWPWRLCLWVTPAWFLLEIKILDLKAGLGRSISW